MVDVAKGPSLNAFMGVGNTSRVVAGANEGVKKGDLSFMGRVVQFFKNFDLNGNSDQRTENKASKELFLAAWTPWHKTSDAQGAFDKAGVKLESGKPLSGRDIQSVAKHADPLNNFARADKFLEDRAAAKNPVHPQIADAFREDVKQSKRVLTNADFSTILSHKQDDFLAQGGHIASRDRVD